MKAFFFLVLVLPLIFAQYEIPDVGVDTTEPTCTNVKDLITRTNEDLSRLQNYYQVTLPNRIMKANNVILSIKKTCKIITRSKPSLVQLSNSKSNSKSLLTLQSLHQQYKDLAASVFTNDNHISLMAPAHLKESLLLETSEVQPLELCQDVYHSVTALLEYLYWLSGAINDNYISSFLPERLGLLSSVYSHCFYDTAIPPTTTTPSTSATSFFADGAQITLRCLGSDYNEAYQYLDSYTYTGGTGLAPYTGGPYSGTHWQVHVNSDGSISLESLGSFKNPSFVYLDGRTGDGSVGLAPYAEEPYSGTHWAVEQLADGSYTFKCLGTDYNPDHLYLDGRTGDGSVGLAPYTYGGYSGTHWDVQFA